MKRSMIAAAAALGLLFSSPAKASDPVPFLAGFGAGMVTHLLGDQVLGPALFGGDMGQEPAWQTMGMMTKDTLPVTSFSRRHHPETALRSLWDISWDTGVMSLTPLVIKDESKHGGVRSGFFFGALATFLIITALE